MDIMTKRDKLLINPQHYKYIYIRQWRKVTVAINNIPRKVMAGKVLEAPNRQYT